MTLEEAASHCESAWSSYAAKHGISREPDAFYLLKMQEELGELTRHFNVDLPSTIVEKFPVAD